MKFSKQPTLYNYYLQSPNQLKETSYGMLGKGNEVYQATDSIIYGAFGNVLFIKRSSGFSNEWIKDQTGKVVSRTEFNDLKTSIQSRPVYRQPDTRIVKGVLLVEDENMSIALDACKLLNLDVVMKATCHEDVRIPHTLKPKENEGYIAAVDLFYPNYGHIGGYGLSTMMNFRNPGIHAHIVTDGYHHDKELEPFHQIICASNPRLPNMIDNVNKKGLQDFARAIAKIVIAYEDHVLHTDPASAPSIILE